jgi:hypothetical protein
VHPEPTVARHAREKALDEVQLPLGGHVAVHRTAHSGAAATVRFLCKNHSTP